MCGRSLDLPVNSALLVGLRPPRYAVQEVIIWKFV